ncbi:MAG: 1-acyl-sn-glycerol-3-phosphate acyltransferase [Prevotellaceae bacterium]|nr:1-acyl-sn-glycerol-3-phosphate acyltransferase [Prevotellaceae bacterium]
MKEKLIDNELLHRISPLIARPPLRNLVMSVAGLNKANRVYDAAKYLDATEVADGLLDTLKIIRRVQHIEVLNSPLLAGKPFITVSNHPYGHVDGIMLIGEVVKVRPDFKVMVNWMLRQIDILENYFIGVNPYTDGEFNAVSSVGGVKSCLTHLQNGHPLGLFPAGSISKNIGHGKARDREWLPSVIKLIQHAGVPVVPAYISGQNSAFFNFLDRFPWWVRNVRLCHELETKRGKAIDLIFGEPVMPAQLRAYTDLRELGLFLRETTYKLAATD